MKTLSLAIAFALFSLGAGCGSEEPSKAPVAEQGTPNTEGPGPTGSGGTAASESQVPSAAKGQKSVDDVAKALGQAIVDKDVKTASSLFVPDDVMHTLYPGDGCAKHRADGQKERSRLERKLTGLHRRGARFLVYGMDNFDGKIEPEQQAKVSLKLTGFEGKRRSIIPKGKTKRKCVLARELEGVRLRIQLEASMEGKTAEVATNATILKVGELGWFLAKL
jgi:hypothetical protein